MTGKKFIEKYGFDEPKNGTVRVAEIKHNSITEVREHISDILFFSGCPHNCKYCFNPKIKDPKAGNILSAREIFSQLSDLSDTVVLSGGDPLAYDRAFIEQLVKLLKLKGKSVVLETTFFSPEIFPLVDKVVFGYKSFAPYIYVNRIINAINAEIVIVIGHTDMKKRGLEYLFKLMEKAEKPKYLTYRWLNDVVQHTQESKMFFDLAEKNKIILREFDGIWLKDSKN